MMDQWRNESVRDLAWVIGSPELIDWSQLGLAAKNAPAWSDLLGRDRLWLSALEADPKPLLDHLAKRPTHRLGIYFEQLLRFWFDHDEASELILQNLPIRSPERTLGELDFVLRRGGRVEHWEVGVKYYLGYRGQGSADAWIGPGCRDTLGRKLRRMMEHQLPIAQTQPAQDRLLELGVTLDQSRAVLKGYLFYPLSDEDSCSPPDAVAADHQRGYWVRASQTGLLDRFGVTQWWDLPKFRWMGAWDGPPERGGVNPSELGALAQARFDREERPFMLMGYGGSESAGDVRCFVVPDSWPQGLPDEKTASP
jgi:hypothetical protein